MDTSPGGMSLGVSAQFMREAAKLIRTERPGEFEALEADLVAKLRVLVVVLRIEPDAAFDLVTFQRDDEHGGYSEPRVLASMSLESERPDYLRIVLPARPKQRRLITAPIATPLAH